MSADSLPARRTLNATPLGFLTSMVLSFGKKSRAFILIKTMKSDEYVLTEFLSGEHLMQEQVEFVNTACT